MRATDNLRLRLRCPHLCSRPSHSPRDYPELQATRVRVSVSVSVRVRVRVRFRVRVRARVRTRAMVRVGIRVSSRRF